MSSGPGESHVVVLAPMPLEMDAVVTAFGLSLSSDADGHRLSGYRHSPIGRSPQKGKLMTTEGVTLDVELSAPLLAEGSLGVDMETSAVAEVCEAHRCRWSVFRCIGDRHFDGLLDERILAATNRTDQGTKLR